jgi:hypothetical protein
MKKGEFWISNFWDGDHGVLIGDRIEPNLWDCIYLKKLDGKKYYKDPGGRVTGNPDDTSVYMGEGQVIEDVFSKFYHVEEEIEIVPLPDMTPTTVSSHNGPPSVWDGTNIVQINNFPGNY